MARCVVCGKQWDNAESDDIVNVVAEYILTEHDLEDEWTLES